MRKRDESVKREAVATPAAPRAIGPYSQAIRAGSLLFVSGQIPLDPKTMSLVEGDFATQAHQVFRNLRAVCEAANGSLADIVKLNIYLTDLANFSIVNEVMAEYFNQPYPARAAIGVSQLPKGAVIEADGVMVV